MADANEQRGTSQPLIKALLWTILAGVSFLAVTGAVMAAGFGSVGMVVATLNGQALFADRDHIDLGSVGHGEKKSVEFWLTNLRDNPIVLTGSTSTCSCTVAGLTVPSTVGPKARFKVPVRITVKPKDGELRQDLTLYTNDPDQSEVRLTITGRLTTGPEVQPSPPTNHAE